MPKESIACKKTTAFAYLMYRKFIQKIYEKERFPLWKILSFLVIIKV